MSTFVLIHGGGDVGWYWHLVEAELRARGHDVVAPDLPADDDSLELDDYADAVVAAVGERRDLVVVGQSYGGFTAPLVAVRLPVDALVFVAGMIPFPGEPPGEWWERTGYRAAAEEQAARDGGLTGNQNPYVSFYHDVPRVLAAQAIEKERAHPSAASGKSPWPLAAMPDVPTHFVLCTEDRFFPPEFLRRVVAERLGIVPDEIAGGHCVALSRPKQLASLFERYAQARRSRVTLADHYDAELRAHHERFRAALVVADSDRVLDIGCGTGQTTRDAARAADSVSVLGLDISEPMLQRARRLAAEEGLQNVAFEHGDAQSHPFPAAYFDCIVSRFGTMFFTDPSAAFTNIARAARPGARLLIMVWQSESRNEWATAIRDVLTVPDAVRATTGPHFRAELAQERPPGGPFSMADPDAVRDLLTGVGFANVTITEVHAPVYYGSDSAAAFDLVRDMREPRAVLARMDAAAAERALSRLRALVSAHQTEDGVLFDSRAWLISAQRKRA